MNSLESIAQRGRGGLQAGAPVGNARIVAEEHRPEDRPYRVGRLLDKFALVILLAASIVGAQAGNALPAWVTADWEYWTQGSGRWIADIREFKSDTEPFDAYGLEWKWGLGKKTLTGRLFAIRDGKEVGTIMNYRSYWHPQERKLHITSFGSDGTLGVGHMTETGPSRTEAIEDFFNPSGSVTRVAFRTERSPGEARNSSFDVAADGTWKLRRTYLFKLEAAR